VIVNIDVKLLALGWRYGRMDLPRRQGIIWVILAKMLVIH